MYKILGTSKEWGSALISLHLLWQGLKTFGNLQIVLFPQLADMFSNGCYIKKNTVLHIQKLLILVKKKILKHLSISCENVENQNMFMFQKCLKSILR